MALPVIYESGLQVFCDAPGEYKAAMGQGTEFLKEVPAAWDETRVLAGAPDEFIVVARKKGPRWFVGAITTTERQVEIPLSFLGTGKFDALSWTDADDSETKPMHVTVGKSVQAAADKLILKMAPAGGAAFVFTPLAP